MKSNKTIIDLQDINGDFVITIPNDSMQECGIKKGADVFIKNVLQRVYNREM